MPFQDARSLHLQLLQGRLAVCRLAAGAAIPAWAASGGEFVSVTRTSDELSVVCSEAAAPKDAQCSYAWRAFKVKGPLDFALTGILDSIAGPLAEAGVSIFAVSTYDTDYVLVQEENIEKAIQALSTAGHRIQRQQT